MRIYIIQHNAFIETTMDFRKKQPEAKSTNSRWGNLKDDDDTNTFQTVKRKTRYNKREEEAQKAREKREQLSGTMPLPGIDSDPIIEKNKGKYVAPGKRSRDNKTSKSTGLSLSKSRNKKPVKSIAPDRNDESLFPTLEGSANIEHKNDDDDLDEKTSFADLVSSTEPPVKKEKIIKNDIKPGWVRLSRGSNGELIKEYGPPVPKSQFWIDWERAEQERKRQALIDTLERNMAYVRWAYPYENWYEPSDDEYDSDNDYEEEWVSEEEN